MARLKEEDIHTTQSNIGPVPVSIPSIKHAYVTPLFSLVVDGTGEYAEERILRSFRCFFLRCALVGKFFPDLKKHNVLLNCCTIGNGGQEAALAGVGRSADHHCCSKGKYSVKDSQRLRSHITKYYNLCMESQARKKVNYFSLSLSL